VGAVACVGAVGAGAAAGAVGAARAVGARGRKRVATSFPMLKLKTGGATGVFFWFWTSRRR
jgi:hypothetical protein